MEMALGAAVLSWGVMSGQVVLGHDLEASRLADIGGMVGIGGGAAGATALAATLLKGVFVGGVGLVAGVTCIPAIALIGGGATILGSFGYVIGDMIGRVLHPPKGFAELLSGGAIVAVGVALMIDGARRIVRDERVLATASKFGDGVIKLAPQASEVVIATWDDLQRLLQEFAESPSAYGTGGATAIGGAAIGSAIAASSVTVFGSSTLGATALSLGLVSAPVWPVVVGGAAGLALGLAAWKSIRRIQGRGKNARN
ncbi:hypothetical protein FBX97_3897 [Herbaspirillum sp. SJZ107]|nr:hypothetical protein FBX97_3897 [Herbaspirillum sp. SJZ107]